MKIVVGTRDTAGLPDFVGNMWVPLQYLTALERLGVEAYWVDRQSALHSGRPMGDGCTRPDRDAHSMGYAAARFDAVAQRACVDVDPGFTQMWANRWSLDPGDHTTFFTVGQNVGRAGGRILTLGVQWEPIFPPVLDLRPACIDDSVARFSTITDRRGSQEVLTCEEAAEAIEAVNADYETHCRAAVSSQQSASTTGRCCLGSWRRVCGDNLPGASGPPRT